MKVPKKIRDYEAMPKQVVRKQVIVDRVRRKCREAGIVFGMEKTRKAFDQYIEAIEQVLGTGRGVDLGNVGYLVLRQYRTDHALNIHIRYGVANNPAGSPVAERVTHHKISRVGFVQIAAEKIGDLAVASILHYEFLGVLNAVLLDRSLRLELHIKGLGRFKLRRKRQLGTKFVRLVPAIVPCKELRQRVVNAYLNSGDVSLKRLRYSDKKKWG